MSGCHDFFGDVIHGTKGSAVLGEGHDPFAEAHSYLDALFRRLLAV